MVWSYTMVLYRKIHTATEHMAELIRYGILYPTRNNPALSLL